jgi:MtN3 and saliva related transmembrane protein
MDYIIILGLMAGVLTTTSFLPQIIKAWKTKSTRDISLAMFIVLCCGMLLWIIYGVLIKSIPVIITNVMTVVLVLIVIFLKLKHK